MTLHRERKITQKIIKINEGIDGLNSLIVSKLELT